MKIIVALLKIALAILSLLLCFIILALARGGPEDYLVIVGYLLVGLLSGLLLLYKKNRLRRGFLLAFL
jgi:hypothetical protein